LPRLGGLMAYGPNVDATFERAAGFADQILRGANPADLPTRFDVAIEPEDGKDARPDDPGIDPGTRRRCDRISGIM
jgi:hypothetical protein